MIEAAFWGFVAASSLVIAAEIAFRFRLSRVVVGLIMAFGVGSLISSISYELVAPAIVDHGEVWFVAVMLLLGSVVFFIGDRVVSSMGGAARKDLRAARAIQAADADADAESDATADTAAPQTSGRGIVLGTVLDGIPESAVLGISLAGGEGVSVALLVAIWVSNFPESLGATAGLEASGVERRRTRLLWWTIVLVSAVAAGLGYLVMAGSDSRTGAGLQAFAAGALLTMIVDELAPEAFRRSALYAGLAATAGFVLTLFLVGME